MNDWWRRPRDQRLRDHSFRPCRRYPAFRRVLAIMRANSQSDLPSVADLSPIRSRRLNE
ncbi:hypothetical protein RBSH_05896 [Rhodopirellula baltica SH28]|uniref:Uncharacterized protein n=1 Tax=Rhodopirellula baltica SH28 TaxID=993517 RepID=K5D7R7_RHOBT|nr:hypothetical protein RBSH_05896 [Rhodopirellula baltica SH28]